MYLTNNRCYVQVLEHVRLPLLSPYFLHDCVENQAVVRQSSECRHLVEEAKMFHLLPDRRAELQSPRTKHRNSAGTVQVHETRVLNTVEPRSIVFQGDGKTKR